MRVEKQEDWNPRSTPLSGTASPSTPSHWDHAKSFLSLPWTENPRSWGKKKKEEVDLGHGLMPHQQAPLPSLELSGSGDTEAGVCPPSPHFPTAARCGVPSDLEEEACL